MANTYTSKWSPARVYRVSGVFTSTVKNSINWNWDGTFGGFEWDGADLNAIAPSGYAYVISGPMSITQKQSLQFSVASASYGISYAKNDNDTPWNDWSANKVFWNSGRLTNTLKNSHATSDSGEYGVAWDGTNIVESCNSSSKLKLVSGRYTTTVKNSISTSGIDGTPCGVSADNNGNTPLAGAGAGALFLLSGRITATVKTSTSDLSYLLSYQTISTTEFADQDGGAPPPSFDNRKKLIAVA